MPTAEENKIFEKAQDCVRCGTCHVIYTTRIKSMRFGKQCPPGTCNLIESFYADGLMYLAVGLMREQFPYSPRAVDTVYSCTQCRYCQTICEEYVEAQTMPVIEELRNKAVREGVGPLPEQKKAIERFKRTGNVYGTSPDKKFSWLKNYSGKAKDLSTGGKASALYFIGSHYAFSPFTENIPASVAALLDKAGIDWGILGDAENCSGYHALALGYADLFKASAQKNIDTFNQLGIKQIIVSCPEDYSTFNLRYPEIAPLNVEVIHTTELFHRLVQDKKIKFKQHKAKITYHDPCHLGRYCGLYEIPRQIIQSIPGIELVEMERNRMDAWCCGAGGGVKLGKQDYAIAVGKDRVEEAVSSGAEILVTACPICIENFNEAKAQGNYPIQIQDLADLLCQSLA